MQSKFRIIILFVFAVAVGIIVNLKLPQNGENLESSSQQLGNATLFLNHNIVSSNSQNLMKLKGLQNLWNTCYMSAVLQILFQILPDSLRKLSSHSPIIQLFFRLKDTRDTNDYRLFKEQVQKQVEVVNGWQQQDAHQFFIQFVELLYNQAQKQAKSQNNIINQLFSGNFIHKLQCISGHKKHNIQNFKYISLSFPENPASQYTLQQLINNQFKPQKIDGLLCQTCNKNTQFEKQTQFYDLPKYLVLHLARFGQSWSGLQKITSTIEYSQYINIKYQKQTSRPGSGYTQIKKYSIDYQLVGLINHMGNLNSGHYIAQVKIADTDPKKSTWYSINDDDVNEISKEMQNVRSNRVYMMVYRATSY